LSPSPPPANAPGLVTLVRLTAEDAMSPEAAASAQQPSVMHKRAPLSNAPRGTQVRNHQPSATQEAAQRPRTPHLSRARRSPRRPLRACAATPFRRRGCRLHCSLFRNCLRLRGCCRPRPPPGRSPGEPSHVLRFWYSVIPTNHWRSPGRKRRNNMKRSWYPETEEPLLLCGRVAWWWLCPPVRGCDDHGHETLRTGARSRSHCAARRPWRGLE